MREVLAACCAPEVIGASRIPSASVTIRVSARPVFISGKRAHGKIRINIGPFSQVAER